MQRHLSHQMNRRIGHHFTSIRFSPVRSSTVRPFQTNVPETPCGKVTVPFAPPSANSRSTDTGPRTVGVTDLTDDRPPGAGATRTFAKPGSVGVTPAIAVAKK